MENFHEDKLELLDNMNKPLLNSNDDEDKDFNYAQNPSVHIIGENDQSDEIMQSLEDVKTKNLLGECIEDFLPTSDLISNPVKEDELLTNSEANLKPLQGPDEEETDPALLEEVTPVAPPSSWLRVSLVTTLVTAWLVFLLYCYLTLTTVCSEVSLHCTSVLYIHITGFAIGQTPLPRPRPHIPRPGLLLLPLAPAGRPGGPRQRVLGGHGGDGGRVSHVQLLQERHGETLTRLGRA